jgi:hypothetical protein
MNELSIVSLFVPFVARKIPSLPKYMPVSLSAEFAMEGAAAEPEAERILPVACKLVEVTVSANIPPWNRCVSDPRESVASAAGKINPPDADRVISPSVFEMNPSPN